MRFLYRRNFFFLTSAKPLKVPISFIMSASLFRMYQRGSHCMDFREILYRGLQKIINQETQFDKTGSKLSATVLKY